MVCYLAGADKNRIKHGLARGNVWCLGFVVDYPGTHALENHPKESLKKTLAHLLVNHRYSNQLFVGKFGLLVFLFFVMCCTMLSGASQ